MKYSEDINGTRYCSECKNCCKLRYSTKSSDPVIEANRIKKIIRDNIKRYGISEEQYWKMVDSQNGLCYLCGKPEKVISNINGKLRRLCIDHDHTCCPSNSDARKCGNCVRKLLCASCNSKLGWVESIGLNKIINYLKGDYDQ